MFDSSYKFSLIENLKNGKKYHDTLDINTNPLLFGLCKNFLADRLLNGVGKLEYKESGKQIIEIKYKKYKKGLFRKHKIIEEFIDKKSKKIILKRIVSIT